MKDICVREWKSLAIAKGLQLSTFIELCFKYEGLPESKDATQLKTEQPEDAVEGTAEAEGTFQCYSFLCVRVLGPYSICQDQNGRLLFHNCLIT